jgi:hypothetical protein
MKPTTIWVGLDVHKETISVAVMVDGAPSRPTVTVRNDGTELPKLMRKLAKEGRSERATRRGVVAIRCTASWASSGSSATSSPRA